MATFTVPEEVPLPTDDCEALRNALQGWGTDEKTIIRILGHRNAEQRKEILDHYQMLYDQVLVDHLKAELSGDVLNALLLWIYDPNDRDAKIANMALKSKAATELQGIVEIACTTSPHHLVSVRQAYCFMFSRSLEEDIVAEVPLPVRKVLVHLVSSFRYDQAAVDSDIASNEAAKMHEAIEAKKLDDDDLIMVLTTRNMFQLRETFKLYQESYGKSIEQDIMDCGQGALETLLKAIVSCINSPTKYFAEVLRNATAKLGTDEGSLTRVIVSRAEIDLKHIREEYNETYSSDLNHDVKGEATGDYEKLLMALLGAADDDDS